MVDKSFYQAASDEVAGGKVDAALWVKINADMPEASDLTKQAKYIQLRAEEIARDHASKVARTTISKGVAHVKKRAIKTSVWLIGVIALLAIAGNAYSEYAELSGWYQRIKSQMVGFDEGLKSLEISKKARESNYMAVRQLGENYEYSDGTTAGEHWKWAKDTVNSQGGYLMKIAVDVPMMCIKLQQERATLMGSIVDPAVRDPSIDPICSLWLSDNSPGKKVWW